MQDRQQDLGLRTDLKVILAGCGGVGSWVAIFLALAGIQDLTLFDPDILEPHNLNRLPYTPDRCGEKKVDVLSGYLSGIRADLFVTRVDEPLTPTILDILWDQHVVVDCTDVLQTQKDLYAWSEKRGAEYVRVGVTTNHITLTSHLSNIWSLEDPPGRCGVVIPAWIAPCSLAASYAVAKVLKFPKLELSMELRDEP